MPHTYHQKPLTLMLMVALAVVLLLLLWLLLLVRRAAHVSPETVDVDGDVAVDDGLSMCDGMMGLMVDGWV